MQWKSDVRRNLFFCDLFAGELVGLTGDHPLSTSMIFVRRDCGHEAFTNGDLAPKPDVTFLAAIRT